MASQYRHACVIVSASSPSVFNSCLSSTMAEYHKPNSEAINSPSVGPASNIRPLWMGMQEGRLCRNGHAFPAVWLAQNAALFTQRDEVTVYTTLNNLALQGFLNAMPARCTCKWAKWSFGQPCCGSQLKAGCTQSRELASLGPVRTRITRQ